MKKKLILIGASLFGEIALNYFKNYSNYEIIGFAVEKEFKNTKKIFDLPLYDLEELENLKNKNGQLYFFVSIVYLKMNTVRERLFKYAKKKGLTPASFISDKAIIDKNCVIGEHCFIFENNVLQFGSHIKNNVILWSGNHIGHHSLIDNNCFISSHCVISGNVKIGKNAFLGVNSTISNDVNIGDYCWVSPSSLVTNNLENYSLIKEKNTDISKINTKKFFKL